MAIDLEFFFSNQIWNWGSHGPHNFEKNSNTFTPLIASGYRLGSFFSNQIWNWGFHGPHNLEKNSITFTPLIASGYRVGSFFFGLNLKMRFPRSPQLGKKSKLLLHLLQVAIDLAFFGINWKSGVPLVSTTYKSLNTFTPLIASDYRLGIFFIQI